MRLLLGERYKRASDKAAARTLAFDLCKAGSLTRETDLILFLISSKIQSNRNCSQPISLIGASIVVSMVSLSIQAD